MNKRVLLVADDDEMNRRIIRRFLNDSFVVLEAEDGEQTLKLINETHIDLLLLDIIMPKVDGLEVLKQMSENGTKSKIGVLVATSTKEKTERTALSLGADDVVSKPYDPIVIQKRLENILAAMEINAQKNLLEADKVSDVINSYSDKISARAKETSEQIHKYTKMINANVENHRLVEQIANEIDKESERFTALLSDNS